MNNIREVKEGTIGHGTTEVWRYSIDTSPVSGTATGTPTMLIFDITNGEPGTDVTSTNASGACSLSGTTITTSLIQNLRFDRLYKCIVRWDVGSSQFRSRYFKLRGEL